MPLTKNMTQEIMQFYQISHGFIQCQVPANEIAK